MQIAICDDRLSYSSKIKELIRQYAQTESKSSFALSTFSTGRELLNYVDENGGFDLYIMDVIMPGMNGIELASSLRGREDTGLVVYLTTSPDFAVDSYRVRAFDYLLRPVDRERFFAVMREAEDHFSRYVREMIPVKTPESVRLIPIRDIRYAERVGRQVIYHLVDDTVINSSTINDSFKNAISELLHHNGMLLVGSSYAVNLFYVTEVTKSDLVISDQFFIPIPRRMYGTVLAEWERYWRNGDTCHVI